MDDDRKRLRVQGSGLLAEALREHLGGGPELPAGLTVVARDGWCPDPPERTDGSPGLTVWTELDKVVIGPLHTPGVPGCPTCARGRRRRARPDAAAVAALRDRHRAELAREPSPWLTESAAHTVAAVVGADVHLLASGGRPRTAGAPWRSSTS
ncbi:hypothetical protein GCM10020358_58630 [Amorphoplanes nipponensis]|uniref:Uncharacterized protein n=1 Tax=Actinoplanes nipponensis TaxID=135950 RepID=A0A919JDD1_9ACTN|nr:TOMM precursor leader peptide-binding protein [Actinoplanes nipponensis]GIE46842.1 hypothetical protein Ani05nite_03760 [Actinoplanes nipponensis]